jgi:DNA-binding GntR family transcriptional regulator
MGRQAKSTKKESTELAVLPRLRPVGKRPKVGEIVYISLKEAIVKGSLQPGQRLVERALGRRMNASRIPIREALKKLEKDGLVQNLAGRGFVVKNLSKLEVEETFGIRAVLESYATALATEQMTDAILNKLQENLDAYRGALAEGDVQKMMEVNTQFDEIIYRTAGSQKLYDLIKSFRDFFARYRKTLLSSIKYAHMSLRDHENIIQAMREGDKESVERIVKNHILEGKDNVLREIDAGKSV